MVSVLFWALCTLSTAGPSFELFTMTKAALLLVDFVILAGAGRRALSFSKPQLLTVGYCVLVAVWCWQWDEYSQRLIYNLLVIALSVTAARRVVLDRRALWVVVGLSMVSLVYRYVYYVNPADGKHQVHQQVLVLALASCFLHKRAHVAGGALAAALDIRSVVFAYVANAAVRWRGVVSTFLVSLSGFLALSWVALDWRAVASFDSLRWRIELWEQLFSGYSGWDWFIGRGLGYSWRQSGELELAGSDFGSTVASHSIYVKVLSDTGLVGLVLYLYFLILLYRRVGGVARRMLLLYVGYGFFDEGIWGFSVLWCLVVASVETVTSFRPRAAASPALPARDLEPTALGPSQVGPNGVLGGM